MRRKSRGELGDGVGLEGAEAVGDGGSGTKPVCYGIRTKNKKKRKKSSFESSRLQFNPVKSSYVSKLC